MTEELKLLARPIVLQGRVMSRTKNVELVLREVLAKELRIKDPKDDDDLVVLDPDFPSEEVVKDVLEIFGYHCHDPSVEDWKRSFSDLVRVIQRELKSVAPTPASR